jgi:archaellum biogenesis protein FlaJ (TadC family)
MIHNDNHSENLSNKDETEIVSSINDSLTNLEQSFSFTTPDLQWFEQKIAQQKEQIRKKWRRDLMLFSTVAVVILMVMFMTLFEKPVLFFFLQGITVFFLIGYTIYHFRRKREVEMNESD